MNNKEEPSVLQRINDEENSELLFMLDAFSYQVSNFLSKNFVIFKIISYYNVLKVDFIDFLYIRKKYLETLHIKTVWKKN